MKKCLILDLDNTLLGGVVVEDGIEGIALSLTNLSKNILPII
jgi:predicted enzyme involved in methoxymalonyl-ACP biosynthesis